MQGSDKEQFVKVTFSINGQTVTDNYPKAKPIDVVVKQLLKKSGNSDDLSMYDFTVSGTDFNVNQKFEVLANNALIVISNKPGTKA